MRVFWTEAEMDRLRQRTSDGVSVANIARELGRTVHAVQCKQQGLDIGPQRQQLRPALDAAVTAIANGESREQRTFSASESGASVTMDTYETVRTLEELITVCEIDTETWEIVKWSARAWGSPAKDNDGTLQSKTLYRIAVELKPKSHAPKHATRGIIDALRMRVKPLRPRSATPTGSGYLFVATMGEPHLGKMAWAPETGESYDLGIACERVRASHRHLMQRALALRPERVAIVLGDDFFTADNPQGTTTAGTPQDMDGRYRKVFRAGVALCREVIEGWREIAPVSVWVKPGNHDTLQVWHAGEVLAAIYSATPDIEIVNPDRLRTYQRWGCCLIGLTHGDKERDDRLPMLMAHEAKEEWAATTCRVWLTGHLHTLKAKTQRAVIQPMRSDVHEEAGVVIRRCRSLSGTDAWHHQLGYVGNIKAAEGFVYSKTLGETDIHTGVIHSDAA